MGITNYQAAILTADVTSPSAATRVLPSVSSFLGKGLLIMWTVSAIAAGQTVALSLQGVAADGSVYNLMQTAAVSAPGAYAYNLFPGAGTNGVSGGTTVSSLSCIIPTTWQLVLNYTDTSGTKAVTQSLSFSEVA